MDENTVSEILDIRIFRQWMSNAEHRKVALAKG